MSSLSIPRKYHGFFPLISKSLTQSIPDLNSETVRKRSYVSDPGLRSLCKNSRAAWKVWNDAGHPSSGSLFEEKKASKKLVRQFVASYRAKKERVNIPERDQMFKENHRCRFKRPSSSTECKRLLVNGTVTSDPTVILQNFHSFFADLASSTLSSISLAVSQPNLHDLESALFFIDEKVLDCEICIDEIESALKVLRLGKSCGINGLDCEHIVFGGETIKIWLKKIFSSILHFEQLSVCLKEGIIVPIYKGRGKDPLLVSSYRGITLSSVIAKLFEVIILRRLSPCLGEAGFPDISQTAYQNGMSCADAIYATRETLLTHVREGGRPFLCLYDIEKAFDSIELPILLKRLYDFGINGKLWRLLKSWYTCSTSCVRLKNCLSNPFEVNRGVKQRSVLSPTLFLIVMDILLKDMRTSNCGLSVRGGYAGATVHTDDLRTTSSSSSMTKSTLLTNLPLITVSS